MNLLDIYHVDTTGDFHLAGQVALDPKSGQVDGELTKDHQLHPDLKRLNNKASRDLFKASLVDCVPDVWGKAVLSILHQLPKVGMEDVAYLPYLSNIDMFVGNTVFIEAGTKLPARTKLPILKAGLLNEADKLDSKEDLSSMEKTLLMAMGAPPGARSKALVKYKGKSSLAKFKSQQDDYDVMGAEYVCMKLASKCGLEVPKCSLVELDDQKILVQERFDIPDKAPLGRYPMMSFRAAAGLTVFVEDDYASLAALVRKYSVHVIEDVEKLYTMMVFNAAVGNIEDHHRNFSFIDRGQGWQLSPYYDVTPAYTTQARYQKVMRLHSQTFAGEATPSKDNLLALAASFGLTDKKALSILDAVAVTIKNNINSLKKYIDDDSRALVVDTLLDGIDILSPPAPKSLAETIGDISDHQFAPLAPGQYS